MKRREFITLVGGAAAAWPFAANAQQPKMPVVGFLSSQAPNPMASRMAAIHQGLKETGYIDGQNLKIEYRWGDGQYDRLPTLVADLIRRHVTVIVATGDSAALAAKAASTIIPIVFSGGNDPIRLGLVMSLNRPGGNVTGVTNLNVELGPKRLELVRELVPAATNVALMINPVGANASILLRDLPTAARALGLQLHVLNASSERDFDVIFKKTNQLRAGALVIGADAFFNSQSEQLAALALRYAVPAVFQFREFAAAGGLISYGSCYTDLYRHVGIYTGRILKGEKPVNLPIIQSTKVELIINLKTAKALGLTVPPTLLARADEVIE